MVVASVMRVGRVQSLPARIVFFTLPLFVATNKAQHLLDGLEVGHQIFQILSARIQCAHLGDI